MPEPADSSDRPPNGTPAPTTSGGAGRGRLAVRVTEEGRPRSFDWSLPTDPGLEFIVGRSRSADLTLRDDHVSGKHLCLTANATGHVLTDLGSTNGTSLNDQPVTPHTPRPLSPGDRLLLGGSAELVYQMEPPSDEELSRAASTGGSAIVTDASRGPAHDENTGPQDENDDAEFDAQPDELQPTAAPTLAGSAGQSGGLGLMLWALGIAILAVIGYFAWVLLFRPS